MVSMVVAVCPLFPPATFVRPHDAKPRVTLTTSAETSTGQGATPLLSAGVLSNGQIRTPGPFRRGVLLSGGRRSATENGTGVARHTFCSYCGMHAFLPPAARSHLVRSHTSPAPLSTAFCGHDSTGTPQDPPRSRKRNGRAAL